MDAAYVELSNLPNDSILRAWMADYKLLRDQVRECNGD